ncbi:MAG: class I SAM-dependent methyltransferase [Acidobacteriota bacterium]|nr:class I SAM-dependent methyltransferase [Acidobacteriota bacterium]
MSARDRVASAYRAIVPEPLRRFVRDAITRRGYSAAFFAKLDAAQAASYDVMAASIAERLHPSAVLDVGSGSGALLAALARDGVTKTTGWESSPHGVAASRRRKVEVHEVDLGQPFTIGREFDLAICLEVAEHLPESLADQFVDGLASGPGVLLFSAATPGQGGENHINEQPHDYWIEKFARRGFAVDEAMTRELRAEWRAADVASWYCNNSIIFRRTRSPE